MLRPRRSRRPPHRAWSRSPRRFFKNSTNPRRNLAAWCHARRRSIRHLDPVTRQCRSLSRLTSFLSRLASHVPADAGCSTPAARRRRTRAPASPPRCRAADAAGRIVLAAWQRAAQAASRQLAAAVAVRRVRERRLHRPPAFTSERDRRKPASAVLGPEPVTGEPGGVEALRRDGEPIGGKGKTGGGVHGAHSLSPGMRRAG